MDQTRMASIICDRASYLITFQVLFLMTKRLVLLTKELYQSISLISSMDDITELITSLVYSPVILIHQLVLSCVTVRPLILTSKVVLLAWERYYFFFSYFSFSSRVILSKINFSRFFFIGIARWFIGLRRWYSCHQISNGQRRGGVFIVDV